MPEPKIGKPKLLFGLCKDCKWWGQDSPVKGIIEDGRGVCHRTVNGGWKPMGWKPEFEEGERLALAWTEDAKYNYCFLVTMSDFGCNQFEGKGEATGNE